jgi:hypothetical protein
MATIITMRVVAKLPRHTFAGTAIFRFSEAEAIISGNANRPDSSFSAGFAKGFKDVEVCASDKEAQILDE